MSSAVSAGFGPSSRKPKEHLFKSFRADHPKTSINKFGTVVRALYPDKPATVLSQELGCTERAAQFYLDGDRRPSVRCVKWLVNEIFPE